MFNKTEIIKKTFHLLHSPLCVPHPQKSHDDNDNNLRFYLSEKGWSGKKTFFIYPKVNDDILIILDNCWKLNEKFYNPKNSFDGNWMEKFSFQFSYFSHCGIKFGFYCFCPQLVRKLYFFSWTVFENKKVKIKKLKGLRKKFKLKKEQFSWKVFSIFYLKEKIFGFRKSFGSFVINIDLLGWIGVIIYLLGWSFWILRLEFLNFKVRIY